jgi:hypothetical protein
MKTLTSLKKSISLVLLLSLMTQSLGTASAAVVLFQDDTFDDVMSDTIRIGSNDAGANTTAIQFGADSTASENGNVTWNIGTNRFSVDHGVDITGTVTTTAGASVSGGTVDVNASSNNATNLNTGTSTGAVSVGGGSGTVSVNSTSWDISTAGVGSGFTGFSSSGTVSFTAGASISGGTANVNASSNNATNINTGTSTGAVAIGGGSGTVAIDSSAWDVSTAGAISGVTTIGASGIVTAGNFQIGTTTLTETTAAGDSGAFLVGAFDEFDNSNSTNVQDILDDFDALIGANLPNVEQLIFHPEYPDAVAFADGATNAGTLVSDRDNTNNRNYYGWTSNNGTTQDMDVRARIILPADFVTIGNFTFEYITGTATTADNRIDVTLINVTDSNTTCATSTNNASTTWATGTITSGSITGVCTGGTALGAGDILEVVMKLHDNSGAGDFSRIGFINQAYTN